MPTCCSPSCRSSGLDEKDLRDIVTILADTEVGEQDDPGIINAPYIGKLCCEDWGLFYDVAMNLQRVDEGVASFGLSDAQAARVHHGVLHLIVAIDEAPKSLRFRLRARVGTHKAVAQRARRPGVTRAGLTEPRSQV